MLASCMATSEGLPLFPSMAVKRRIRPRVLWLIMPMGTLFVSFLFSLLVSLSIPIIKTLYLVQVTATPTQPQPPTDIATILRFGVWGFCGTSVLGNGVCSPPRLGYDLSPAVLAVTGFPQVAQVVEEVLTVVLVLHPIAAGLTLLALIIAIPGAQMHGWEILTLVTTIIAALMMTVVLGIDFGLIGEMHSRVGGLTDGEFAVGIGNGPWLMLVAMILLWVSVVGESAVACNCFGLGRRRDWNTVECAKVEYSIV